MDDHFGRGRSVEEAVADGGDVVVLKKLEDQPMSGVLHLFRTWCSSRFCCVYRRKTVPISSGGEGNMSR